MGAASSAANSEVWPPDWEAMPEEKRKLARNAILSLSESPAEDFLAIGNAAHAIAPAAWKFEEYHAAAAAAVQEDIKLNKIIYKLVPRKLSESDFWRLYFSEVLYVLDSVKTHGQYPPPVRARESTAERASMSRAAPAPFSFSCADAHGSRERAFGCSACAQPPSPKATKGAGSQNGAARKVARPPADDSTCALM